MVERARRSSIRLPLSRDLFVEAALLHLPTHGSRRKEVAFSRVASVIDVACSEYSN